MPSKMKKSWILTVVMSFGLATHASSSSLYRFSDMYTLINPAAGDTSSTTYLMKFGFFNDGFTPSNSNVSIWDANFTGVAGSYTPGDALAYTPGGTLTYDIEFRITNNNLYTIGKQLYMVVYNVAPTAAASTATGGAILTHTAWTAQPVSGIRNRQTVWYDYWYTTQGRLNNALSQHEYNWTPPANISNFSSPVNTLTAIPNSGVFSGTVTVATSFIVIPEPSTYALFGIGAMGMLIAVSRRKKTA